MFPFDDVITSWVCFVMLEMSSTGTYDSVSGCSVSVMVLWLSMCWEVRPWTPASWPSMWRLVWLSRWGSTCQRESAVRGCTLWRHTQTVSTLLALTGVTVIITLYCREETNPTTRKETIRWVCRPPDPSRYSLHNLCNVISMLFNMINLTPLSSSSHRGVCWWCGAYLAPGYLQPIGWHKPVGAGVI